MLVSSRRQSVAAVLVTVAAVLVAVAGIAITLHALLLSDDDREPGQTAEPHGDVRQFEAELVRVTPTSAGEPAPVYRLRPR